MNLQEAQEQCVTDVITTLVKDLREKNYMMEGAPVQREIKAVTNAITALRGFFPLGDDLAEKPMKKKKKKKKSPKEGDKKEADVENDDQRVVLDALMILMDSSRTHPSDVMDESFEKVKRSPLWKVLDDPKRKGAPGFVTDVNNRVQAAQESNSYKASLDTVRDCLANPLSDGPIHMIKYAEFYAAGDRLRTETSAAFRL